MSRAITSVDRTVLGWIMLAPDPEALLAHIERAFLESGGRLGYLRTGRSLEKLSGGRDDLENVVAMEDGTLSGVIQVREDPPALNWERGTLSIWRGGEIMPATIVPSLAGRTLGGIVDHPMLPAEAVVTEVSDQGAWLRLACSGYRIGVDGARKAVAAATTGKGRTT